MLYTRADSTLELFCSFLRETRMSRTFRTVNAARKEKGAKEPSVGFAANFE